MLYKFSTVEFLSQWIATILNVVRAGQRLETTEPLTVSGICTCTCTLGFYISLHYGFHVVESWQAGCPHFLEQMSL